MTTPTSKKKKSRHESPLTGQATGAISSVPLNNKRRKKPDFEKPASKKSQLRARKEALEKLEEERLTALLFGGEVANDDGASTGGIDSDDEDETFDVENSEDDNGAEGDFTFEIDRGGQQTSSDNDEPKEEELGQAWNDDDEDDAGEHSIAVVDDNDDEDDEDSVKEEAAPAWEDPDDAKTALIDGSSRLKKLRRSRQETEALSSHELEQRLRQRYEASSQSTARTDWATKTKEQKIATDDDEDNDDGALALFSASKSLLASSRNQLAPNILDLVRCPDANLTDPNKAVVRCIDFHPGSDPDKPLMLTAGLDKTLRFFQVGEEKSEKIHGIHCKFFSFVNWVTLLYDYITNWFSLSGIYDQYSH